MGLTHWEHSSTNSYAMGALKRVAVVGSGISGLTCARELYRSCDRGSFGIHNVNPELQLANATSQSLKTKKHSDDNYDKSMHLVLFDMSTRGSGTAADQVLHPPWCAVHCPSQYLLHTFSFIKACIW